MCSGFFKGEVPSLLVCPETVSAGIVFGVIFIIVGKSVEFVVSSSWFWRNASGLRFDLE